MRRYAACIAAALLIASAGAALGEDTINGKPLNGVRGIVREAGGSEASLSKAQILKIMQFGDDLRGSIFVTPPDPSRKADHIKLDDVLKMTDLEDIEHYTGIMAAASTRPVNGAKRRIVVGDLSFAGGGGGIKTFLTEPTDSADLFGSVRHMPINIPDWERNYAFTDIRGGLFIDGERDESFVVGFMNDEGRKNTFSGGDNGGKDAHVGFLILDGRRLNNESFTGDPTAYVKSNQHTTDSQFPVLRIVAGDFDHDGIASEIACFSTPKGRAYNLDIYKVKRNSDGKTEVKGLLKSINVGDIRLDAPAGRERDTEAGCDIVAGDFDGDGLTEIACVMVCDYMGTTLSPYIETWKYVKGYFRSSYDQIEGTALDEISRRFQDLCNTKVQGMLAVAGDFDGNGRDEVAFSTISDQDTTYVATFAFDAVANGTPNPVLKGVHSEGHGSKRDKDYTPLASVVSLAAGPTYKASGSGGPYDELYMTLAPVNGSPVLYRVLDPLGSISLDPIEDNPDNAKSAALIISDFVGESTVEAEPEGDEPASGGGGSSGCSTGAAGAFAIALLAAATRRICLKRHI